MEETSPPETVVNISLKNIHSKMKDENDKENNNKDTLPVDIKSKMKLNLCQIHRKISNSSDDSSLLDSDYYSSPNDESTSPESDDISIIRSNCDDITEKISELHFFTTKDNIEINIKEKEIEKNINNKKKKDLDEDDDELEEDNDDDDDDDDDDDLRSRAPLRPYHHHHSQSRHKPYVHNWLEDITSIHTSDFESTVDQILSNREYSEMINPCLDEWINMNSNNSLNHLNNTDHKGNQLPTIPSITVENSMNEELLIEMINNEALQSAQQQFNNSSPTRCSENWPDSPASSNLTSNILSSQCHSQNSSRPQSPGSVANIGSPYMHSNTLGSPCELQNKWNSCRVANVLSSSSSSSHSFSDTASPSNYNHNLIDSNIEELDNQFVNLSNWYESSGTVIQSTDDLKLAIQQDLNDDYNENKIKNNEDINSSNNLNNNFNMFLTNNNNLERTGILISSIQNNLVYPEFDDIYKITSASTNNQQIDINISDVNNIQNDYQYTSPVNYSHFNDFQIPSTVTSIKFNRFKHSKRKIENTWLFLNMPQNQSSKKLKESLDPKDVEKAMRSLLKKSIEELTQADKDGDTMLMCLVGNPDEMEKKKAYLIPLVERLGAIKGGLTQENKRGEDALYLASINCPQMEYVSGYLGGVMLDKGIDISQGKYKGNTLIHSLVCNGDTYFNVINELLSLKTKQGNMVFDLSKWNYDGRTPLHVAAEAHNPTVNINSVNIVNLLIENGADPKIKESKYENTALHLAVSLSFDPLLIKALLNKSGKDAVNITNRNYDTPLHIVAAMSNNIDFQKQIMICQMLIQSGASTNLTNKHGQTPLALFPPERKDKMKQIFRKKTNLIID